MNRRFYTITQWTWGLPQTLIGAAVYFRHRNDRHFDYNGALVTEWDKRSGISLGKFIFVPREAWHDCLSCIHADHTKGPHVVHGTVIHSGHDHNSHANRRSGFGRFLLEHEYGHSVQSLILGPAYLPLVGLPSFVWNRLPYFRNRRKKTGKSYYSVPFESSANALGAKAAAKAHAKSAAKASEMKEPDAGIKMRNRRETK